MIFMHPCTLLTGQLRIGIYVDSSVGVAGVLSSVSMLHNVTPYMQSGTNC